MKGIVDTVQKRIGLLIGSLGSTMVVVNILYRMQRGDFFFAVNDLSVWPVFLITLPFIFSIFFESSFLKKYQVAGFALMGAVNIIDSYEEFYGPGLFLAAWLLMRHYGYLDRYTKTKNAIILLLVTGLSQLSANLHTGEGVYAGFSTLMYTLFLVTLLVILWRDMVKQQLLLKRENVALKMDYGKLSAQLAELEEEQKPYDLKAAKITPAEERVIEALTVYKAGNREIAERLNIAESTVKLHIYNICNKIGVDNRFAIIDLCKYNFPDKREA